MKNEPHVTCTTVARLSRARKPNRPEMNCPRPPEKATKGKMRVGVAAVPYQAHR